VADPTWTPPNAEYPPPKAGEPPLHVAGETPLEVAEAAYAELDRSPPTPLTGLDSPGTLAFFQRWHDARIGRSRRCVTLLAEASSGS
jgi:hypothetical protein